MFNFNTIHNIQFSKQNNKQLLRSNFLHTPDVLTSLLASLHLSSQQGYTWAPKIIFLTPHGHWLSEPYPRFLLLKGIWALHRMNFTLLARKWAERPTMTSPSQKPEISHSSQARPTNHSISLSLSLSTRPHDMGKIKYQQFCSLYLANNEDM